MVRAMFRVLQKAMREEGSRQPRHCERVCKLCATRPTQDEDGEISDSSDFFCHHFLQDSRRIARDGQQWWAETRANMTTNLTIDWPIEMEDRLREMRELGLTPEGEADRTHAE